MALYLIGDVQGCHSALQRLLDEISFSASRDTLYFLGDLVNRGPDSQGVLRHLMRLGTAVRSVLGNHDLNLLAIAYGVRKAHRKDTLSGILEAPDRLAMLDWLRWQQMAILEKIHDQEILMVHAGVLPAWTATKTIALGSEVESVLRGPDIADFLQHMYGDEPSAWSDSLTDSSRLRVIVNALTRMRFCDAAGHMEFASKEGANANPPGYLPWFDVPGRRTASTTIAFGHWSTLGWLNRPDLLSLDTGCVWGGCLSALRLNPAGSGSERLHSLIQVRCQQTQKPG